MSTLYGRDEVAWDELTRAGSAFLIERARLEKVTSYTEMNYVLAQRTGQPTFDFAEDAGRAAMGRLLGRIVDATWLPAEEVMISAIVLYLNQNDAGPGFYALAADKGLIPRKSGADAKFEFWANQVTRAYEVYGAGASRRR